LWEQPTRFVVVMAVVVVATVADAVVGAVEVAAGAPPAVVPRGVGCP
jgi:hypothetical protein